MLGLALEYTIDYLSLIGNVAGDKSAIEDLENIGFNILSAIGIGWFLLMLFINLPILGTLFRFICDAVLILVSASILYGVSIDIIPSLNPEKPTWLSLILGSILYLPCLIHTTIKTKLDISVSQTLAILILFEILVLYLKFLPGKLNPLLKSISSSVVLQKEPIYIDRSTDVTNLSAMYGNNTSAQDYHFAVSLDFWINPQPISTAPSYSADANVFTLDGRPAVKYNSGQRKLKITFVNEDAKDVVLFESNDIPLQTWNNLVVNYDGGTVDVFLNGNLVSSHPGITPYFSKAAAILGEENGIAGGIKEVKYYNHTLQPQQIKANALL